MDENIRDAYKEDTWGRKWRPSIITKPTPHSGITTGATPVQSVNINKPLNKEMFSALSPVLKKYYIESLIERFGVNRMEIARKIGYEYSGFCKLLKSVGIERAKKAPRSIPKDKQKAWSDFWGEAATESLSEPEDETAELIPSKVTHSSFVQSGCFNKDEFLSRLNVFLKDGENARIESCASSKQNLRERASGILR